MNDRAIDNLDIHSVKADSDTGYILKVSLKYPASLHDFTNDYPLFPEKIHVDDADLSPYTQRLWKQLHGTEHIPGLHTKRAKVGKLVLTLNDKDNYGMHYRTLQLYLQLGMNIKQVHMVLQFHKESYPSSYIEFSTQCRKVATTEFEKDLYNLLSNSTFGKTLQNSLKYMDIKLAHTEKKLRKYAAKNQRFNV